jgi:hypothetical protein
MKYWLKSKLRQRGGGGGAARRAYVKDVHVQQGQTMSMTLVKTYM